MDVPRNRLQVANPQNTAFVAGRSVLASRTKYPLEIPIPSSILLPKNASTAAERGFINRSSEDELGSPERMLQHAIDRHTLLTEYTSLLKIFPPGVIVLPSVDSLVWTGAVLLRQGWYRGGIFPFKIDFRHAKYPDEPPTLLFDSPPPPHSRINPTSGEVDFGAHFENWSANNYSVLDVLNFAKQLFYSRDLLMTGEPHIKNTEIAKMQKEDKSGFLKTISLAVDERNALNASNLTKGRFLSISASDEAGEAPLPTATEDVLAELIDSFRTFSRNEDLSVNNSETFVDWFLEEFVPRTFSPEVDQ